MQSNYEINKSNGETIYLNICKEKQVIEWGNHFGNGHTDNCTNIPFTKFVYGLDEFTLKSMVNSFGIKKIKQIQEDVKSIIID